MSTPTYCTSCGHELGVGRFCTNCGKPVPGRHPEATPGLGATPAEVGATAGPTVPPPATQLPPQARYPLFADGEPTVVRAPDAPPAILPPPAMPAERRGTPGWLPWLVGLALLAVIAGLGGFLLASGGDDDKAADERSSDGPSAGAPSDDAAPPSEPEQPDSTGTGAPVAPPDPVDVVDLTTGIRAEVPAVAPPSRDSNNRPVRYSARKMWDGKARTTWRMPGDGTGQTITFDLGRDVVLTEVGMINGYAKVDGPNDWYAANRRIRTVQWEFDDGTRITQELGDDRQVQMAQIGAVATRTVTVHLLAVSEPGAGTAGRDFTAISEVRFLGTAA
ncbi:MULTISPECIES: zinc ribbon domain-containing protein [unclassified Nocardioides]|uniref:zinc ribbon domain-containing protein n=1 Tax=unclassified Nocardioides TaxID=2615069 RepID=UPI000703A640|nr:MULTISPECIES: zinc ribbon domain-containing protein [unclassified Nocardioides]KRC56716.1 hypothetical protein ASE19_02510 [Nocardioides sp. Root79]KRC76926.1 hypothetical protein ASE20_01380 [Nocardioides sp. Root240]